MLKATRPAWTCSRCLLRQQQRLRQRQRQQQCRALATAATAPETFFKDNTGATPLVYHGTPGAARDDEALRQIFDSPSFWRDFSSKTRSGGTGSARPSGLFQNRHLKSPAGFQQFAAITVRRCQGIVAKVISASTLDEYKAVVTDLDRLSDLLCRVIDLSDFVRSTHPDRQIQAAASQAHALMFEYMNVLNTTTELNDQLKRASEMPEVWGSWSEEEQLVAKILLKDFAQSAIDLPAEHRQQFVNLSNDIAQLGHTFVDTMEPARPFLSFPSSRLKGMDPLLVRQLTKWGTTTLPSIGRPATMALRSVVDENTRRDIFMASRTASGETIGLLEEMLEKRAELAKLSGFSSYAEMTLGDKMAKSPAAVSNFLQALAADNLPRVQKELSDLLALKQSDPYAGRHPAPLNPWDRDFYSQKLIAQTRAKRRNPDFLSSYFSLGTVMQGISRLFSRLYGIRLVPHETLPGEIWNTDVRRLDVLDENDGHIAVVYCDLFERAGKNPHPAHFTLRCSRRISDAETHEAQQLWNHTLPPDAAAVDGMACARNAQGELYQLPTIALICDFARHPASSSYFSRSRSSSASPYPKSHPSAPYKERPPALLTFRQVQTLFHEMGHAVHSMLGRTALQNVSGTRCATDFAELPSVLMEHFAADRDVLALFARHWESDAPLPYQMVQDKLDLDHRLAGSETESQVLLAMLDQAFHSDGGAGKINSTATYHAVLRANATLPDPEGTSWHGFYGHLFNYGATYYAYLFDRAIAGKVWEDVFGGTSPANAATAGSRVSSATSDAGGWGAATPGRSANSATRNTGGASAARKLTPLSRASGEIFKSQVLRWGGGRDGWRCIAGALDGAGAYESSPASAGRGSVFGAASGRGLPVEKLAEGGADAMAEVGRWGIRD